MDPHTAKTGQPGSSSLYGYDLLDFVRGYEKYSGCAYDAAAYVVTHGHNYPMEQAINSLGVYDRAAFEALAAHRHLGLSRRTDAAAREHRLAMYVNTLGRLHIRRAEEPRPIYDKDDRWIDVGVVDAGRDVLAQIEAGVARAKAVEAAAFQEVRRALDRAHAAGELAGVLEQVIDHVEHVESVCFYVGDRFYALIDRYVNLVDTKGGKGCLPRLRGQDYARWSDEDVLIVAALHALFLSGRSVRFEEFNGIVLSAQALLDKLNQLLDAYRAVGCTVTLGENADIFEIAREIRQQTLRAVGRPWLRYRWIYGLNFQKNERMLASTHSTEDQRAHLAEFDDDYAELIGARPHGAIPEHLFFTQLASACLVRDLQGIKCERGSSAATGWIEYLMERIVASAVLATDSDYGMSSSLKDMSRLVEYDRDKFLATMHALTPADFFTCFVSYDFRGRLEGDTPSVIASSVQKRMMFNRWHFIPGNFEREAISQTRHWYYPPLIPDIAVHSDMHRMAHNRARVKYSIRAPGPDMSRPPLQIAGQRYRGFYDVRVVRMEGEEYGTEEMLRTRRRTLWMEAVYAVLTSYLQSAGARSFAVKGFQAGMFLDLPKTSGRRVEAAAAVAGRLGTVGAA